MLHRFTARQKDDLITKLQSYFSEELDQQLTNFETEFLLDFLSQEFAPHYYNQAIKDVQAHLTGFIENINERIDELEKPLPIAKTR